MDDESVLLVSGVGGYWGRKLAQRLLDVDGIKVIGIDRLAPSNEIPGLDFILADSSNPLLAELLHTESVSAVCHLDFTSVIEADEAVTRQNVSGLANVLGACAEADVERIVVKSSTAVYGARPDNSLFLSEESPLRGSKNYGYSHDLLEIEALCNGFRSQWQDIGLTVLRFANIIGTAAQTPMSQFLSLRTPPILFGFDPIMQMVHEDDVVEALAHAMLNESPGAFNVAAEDAMPLSRILRLARCAPIPIIHPLAYRGMRMLAGTGLDPERYVPIEWDYLRYSLVTDLSGMVDELAFRPVYTAAEGLREFAGQQRIDGGDGGTRLAEDEQHLRDIIERRRRQRERRANV
ncbi:MAG: NAD-dependent epimerase/dehydratase family protein [Chloroflexota bacterium]|jgi:UDP-glucose 4-epimerase